MIVRGLRTFGAFWVDFLVGDAPEIFVGVLLVVGDVLLFRHDRAVGLPLAAGLTVAVFLLSTFRGRQRAS